MKGDNMFKTNLQIFGGDNEEDLTGDKPLEDEPNKKELKQPEIPQINVEEITKKVAEELAKSGEEKIQNITDTFEKKFKAMEDSAKEKEINYTKIIEGLKEGIKGNTDVKDILSEIEKNKANEEKAQKDKELLELAQTSQAKARVAIEEKEDLLKQIEENKIASDLALEKQKFRNALIEEKTNKPWLAEKLDRVLVDEDYEAQKTDYRALMKFFDTEDEKDKYESKKKAGSSAFNGIRVTDDKGKKEGILEFGTNYLNKILGK